MDGRKRLRETEGQRGRETETDGHRRRQKETEGHRRRQRETEGNRGRRVMLNYVDDDFLTTLQKCGIYDYDYETTLSLLSSDVMAP